MSSSLYPASILTVVSRMGLINAVASISSGNADCDRHQHTTPVVLGHGSTSPGEPQLAAAMPRPGKDEHRRSWQEKSVLARWAAPEVRQKCQELAWHAVLQDTGRPDSVPEQHRGATWAAQSSWQLHGSSCLQKPGTILFLVLSRWCLKLRA